MGEVAQEFSMISLCYVSADMMNKYVMAGLRVAQELGGIVVTVQKPGLCLAEKAVLFNDTYNLRIVEAERISVEEHEQHLRLSIAEIKND